MLGNQMKIIVMIICTLALALGHGGFDTSRVQVDYVESVPIDIIPVVRRDSQQSYQRRRRSIINSADSVLETELASEAHVAHITVETSSGEAFLLSLRPNSNVLRSDLDIQVDHKSRPELKQNLLNRAYTGRVYTQRWKASGACDKGDFGSQGNETTSLTKKMMCLNGVEGVPWLEPVGWARIFILSFENPLYEGVFTQGQRLYTIQLTDHYMKLRGSNLPSLRPGYRQPSMLLLFQHDQDEQKYSDSEIQSPATTKGSPGEHVRVRKSQMNAGIEPNRCGTDDLLSNRPLASDIVSSLRGDVSPHLNRLFADLQKRAPGCPGERKIVYMGVAADCTYVNYYGTPQAALAALVSNWNKASQLFEQTFNIALGIAYFQIMTTCSSANPQQLSWNRECSMDYSITNRLNDFSQWRGNKSADTAGLWHLLTKCSSGATVGIAWTNTVCKSNISQVQNGNQMEFRTGAGVSSVNLNEWMVVAHETAHNFGAVHDCVAATCPCTGPDCITCCPCGNECDCRGNYLMNPTSNIKQALFSPCSVSQVCNKLANLGTCLSSPGSRPLIGIGVCGNGVLEDGEECDCGDPEDPFCKSNPCCVAKTCKLKPGAQCSDSNGGCCSKCQLMPSGTVCRKKKGSCDIEEQCSGRSPLCPQETTIPDGTSCEGGKYCASGECTSRDLQCQQAGQDMRIQSACADTPDECNLSCQMALDRKCVQLSGFFLDGTDCTRGGRCARGVCVGQGLSREVIIAIVLGGVVALGLVVGLLVWCYVKRWQKKGDQRMSGLDLKDSATRDGATGEFQQHDTPMATRRFKSNKGEEYIFTLRSRPGTVLLSDSSFTWDRQMRSGKKHDHVGSLSWELDSNSMTPTEQLIGVDAGDNQQQKDFQVDSPPIPSTTPQSPSPNPSTMTAHEDVPLSMAIVPPPPPPLPLLHSDSLSKPIEPEPLIRSDSLSKPIEPEPLLHSDSLAIAIDLPDPLTTLALLPSTKTASQRAARPREEDGDLLARLRQRYASLHENENEEMGTVVERTGSDRPDVFDVHWEAASSSSGSSTSSLDSLEHPADSDAGEFHLDDHVDADEEDEELVEKSQK